MICAGALVQLRPPQHDDLGFSTATAYEHLAVIAAEPRPLASPYNGAIRQYLLDEFNALERFDVSMQPHRFNDIEEDKAWDIGNVIARLPGSTQEQAVMLVAHFDSVEDGPGAGDDGAAVAALLETARILSEGPPLRRDVYFLLTDGEERGLWGAKAFVQASDHVDFAGVVFNFEARGSSGPSLMFETSGPNRWLIREYARAVDRPVASSISDDLYHAMPNDTDLTEFAKVNIPGMNFAFIGTPENYHTANDDIANLDPASLRHHGLQALALAKHFGNLETFGQDDDVRAVYFSFPWIGLIHYPAQWAVPSSIAAIICALFACSVGLLRRWVTPGRLASALALCIVQLAVVGGLAYGIMLVRDAGLTTTAQIAGHLFITAGAMVLLTQIIGRLVGHTEACLAGLLWTAVFALMTGQPQPASSYLFVWPAVFGSFGWVIVCARNRSHIAAALGCLLTAPAIVILLPVAYLAALGLGVQAGYVLRPMSSGYPVATLLAFFPALLMWQAAIPLHGSAGRTRIALSIVLALGGTLFTMMA